MASGKDLFKGANTYTLKINGEINGKKFVVSGRGNKATDGHIEITAVCESGDLPCSWTTLTQAMGYGFIMFTKYPEDIVDFFKDCFPEGMTLNRTQTYHDGGVINTCHKYTYDHGNIHSEVTFKGEGFSADGDVMKKNILKLEPCYRYISPFGQNAVKEHFTNHYLTPDGRYVTSTGASTFTSAKPKQRLPVYHQVAVQTYQAKNGNLAKDHVIQTEILMAAQVKVDAGSL